MKNELIICLGSNINPENNIQKASLALQNLIEIIRKSKAMKTTCVGNKPMPDFINCLIQGKTPLNYQACKVMLKETERKLGRTTKMDNHSPRVIDLDLIIWNNKVMDKNVYEFDFIQVLLKEINATTK